MTRNRYPRIQAFHRTTAFLTCKKENVSPAAGNSECSQRFFERKSSMGCLCTMWTLKGSFIQLNDLGKVVSLDHPRTSSLFLR